MTRRKVSPLSYVDSSEDTADTLIALHVARHTAAHGDEIAFKKTLVQERAQEEMREKLGQPSALSKFKDDTELLIQGLIGEQDETQRYLSLMLPPGTVPPLPAPKVGKNPLIPPAPPRPVIAAAPGAPVTPIKKKGKSGSSVATPGSPVTVLSSSSLSHNDFEFVNHFTPKGKVSSTYVDALVKTKKHTFTYARLYNKFADMLKDGSDAALNALYSEKVKFAADKSTVKNEQAHLVSGLAAKIGGRYHQIVNQDVFSAAAGASGSAAPASPTAATPTPSPATAATAVPAADDASGAVPATGGSGFTAPDRKVPNGGVFLGVRKGKGRRHQIKGRGPGRGKSSDMDSVYRSTRDSLDDALQMISIGHRSKKNVKYALDLAKHLMGMGKISERAFNELAKTLKSL